MDGETDLVAADSAAETALIEQIVGDGVRRYFNERRRRIGPFVDRNFSLRGSIRLHREAVGWDIARAPKHDFTR